jgi:glycosyltransferase involved in cell wall biosynthesis
MTVFNGMPYLVKSVDSILSQTYQDVELVVVDDGSTDDSLAYLNSLSDPRLKVIQGGRLGRGKALNLGLRHCKGTYIAINDADDISYPDRIEKQVQFLEEHKDHVLVGSLSYFMDHNAGEKIVHKKRPLTDEGIKEALTKGQPIQHVTAMIRKEAILTAGGYNENISFLFDRDLFLKLGRLGRLANLSEPLVEVGHHESRFFYFNYKGLQREYWSLRYRIKAILLFHFPKWWIIREIVRSLWTLTPGWVRHAIITTYRKMSLSPNADRTKIK